MLYTNSISFPNMFNIESGNTVLDSEILSINRCLGLLLTTAKGELLGDPDFGCDLYKNLFDQYSSEYADVMKDSLVNDILKYESRITLTSTDIKIDNSSTVGDRNAYNITISYKLKNSNTYNDFSLTLSEMGVN